jgi:Tol biopolymer transport system component
VLPLVAAGCTVFSRVSVDSAGNESDGQSWSPGLSGDGRYVAFASAATNLVAGDTNRTSDIFVHDRRTGTTMRVSVGSDGDQADGPSNAPSISSNGRFVVFASDATNLVADDVPNSWDVFLRDRRTGTTARVSDFALDLNDQEPQSEAPVISGNGRFVVYRSTGTFLRPGDHGSYQIFVYDRRTGATTELPGVMVDDEDFGPPLYATSADGRYIAYTKYEWRHVDDSLTGVSFAFVYDRRLGTTTRLAVDSQGTEPNGSTGAPAISADGTTVVFASAASNWVADDTNGQYDVFAYDLETRTIERVSAATTDHRAAWVGSPRVSADGRYVTFADPRFVRPVPNFDLLLYDRERGTTTLLAREALDYAITSDMACFAFVSDSPVQVPHDTNQVADVFVGPIEVAD